MASLVEIDESGTRTEDPVTLVIGATGLIGCHIVQRLLQKRKRVRAICRVGGLEKAMFLYNLVSEGVDILKVADEDDEYVDAGVEGEGTGEPCDKSLLEIVEADIYDASSMATAFSGTNITCVLHCATPEFVQKIDPDSAEEVVSRHTEQMQIVCDLCQSTESVKKIVVASCLLSVCDEYKPGKLYDESDWNVTSCSTRRVHAYAKTCTEKLLVDYCKRDDCTFRFASILCSTPLLGPHLKPKGMNQSYEILLLFLEGRIMGIPNLNLLITDCRDAANAMVMAMEEIVVGRVIVCTQESIPLKTVLENIVQEGRYHELNVPKRNLTDVAVKLAVRNPKTQQEEWMLHNVGRNVMVSTDKAQMLGMVCRDPMYTVLDTCAHLKDISAIHPTTSMAPACSIL